MNLKEQLRKYILYIAIPLLSVLLGLLIAQRNVGLDSQLGMVETLFPIASVVFGILGVWIAVLDPSAVLDRVPTDTSTPRTADLAIDLSPVLVMATVVFLGVIVLRFSGPLLPDEWFAVFWSKAVLGTIVSSLYVLEIVVLIEGSLRPIAKARRKRREDKLRQGYRE